MNISDDFDMFYPDINWCRINHFYVKFNMLNLWLILWLLDSWVNQVELF